MLHKIYTPSTKTIETVLPDALAMLGLVLGVNPELPLPLSRRELELDAKGNTQIPAGCGSLEKRGLLLPCAL